MATSTIQTSVEQLEFSTWTPSGPSRSPTQTSDSVVLSTDNITSDETVIQELKPVDGGVAAWTVLVTAFVFEAVLWGAHSSFSPTPNLTYLTRDRIPHLLRRLRRVLFHDPRIFIQLFQNSPHRDPRPRALLPRCSLLRNNRQALPPLPASTNLGRLALLYPGSRVWILHNVRRWPNHHARNNVRRRVRDAVLSYH
jgi:hypothetical protein